MSGGCPAGSSRVLRLDPFALPARFEASDVTADQSVRHVELYRERVVMRRAVRGMRMALNMPISAFRGVSICNVGDAAVVVTLEHRDPGLSLPLCVSGEPDEIIKAWHDWASVLGVPLLVVEQDNTPVSAGVTRVGEACPRRRRRSTIKARRPSILMRRGVKRLSGDTAVHRAEREIIARN
jgi:hypothetical protein